MDEPPTLDDLTSSDRRMIAACLLELSRSCNELVLAAVENPSPTSAAAIWARSRYNVATNFGPKLFKSACNSIALSVVSAADNVDSFVQLVRLRQGATSTAPLVRAALEAYARVFFMLDVEDDAQFFHSYLLLTHDELKYAVRHSKFVNAAGEEVDGPAYRQELAGLIGVFKFDGPADFGMAGQIGRLLARSLGEAKADPAIYSQLSGVAHGAASAVAMFVGRAQKDWSFVLPRDVALEYFGYLFAAITTVADIVVDAFQPDVSVVDRWNASRRTANDLLG